jgi:hypothetical protein
VPTFNLNSQRYIIVRNLGFLEVHQNFQGGQGNALASIDGWNTLRAIPASIEPRAPGIQIGVFSPGQTVNRQI